MMVSRKSRSARAASTPRPNTSVSISNITTPSILENIKVSTSLPELPAVQGDEVELRHVFMNLLLNARDAMPQGGEIQIEGGLEGERVKITIADEGRGIPQESLERVFDPFFTTKGAHGTGLGLSMAHSVMSRLGGEIRAGNRPQGGAVFILTFPGAEIQTTKAVARREARLQAAKDPRRGR